VRKNPYDLGARDAYLASLLVRPDERDLLEEALTFLEREGAPGLYHCVNTGAVSWADFARFIVTRCGIDAAVTGCTTAEWPTAARRPAFSALNNDRLSGCIGPVEPWEEALDIYLATKGYIRH
jgi:dTDP-4-dehydrorhamnose reductase